jgi:glycosyltransferase involved in cell wall biosynthesis
VQAISIYSDVVVFAVLPVKSGIREVSLIQDDFDTEFKVRVIKVFYSTPNRDFGIPGKIVQFIRYSVALIRGGYYLFRKAEQFDLVHINVLSRTAVPALLLKFFKGIPYIITEHWSRYLHEKGSYKGFIRKGFTKFVVKNASAITTVSLFLKNGMIKRELRNENFYVIPNTVNTSLFTSMRKQRLSGKKRFIHISNFNDPVKNTSAILRAIARISLTRTDFECHFIGGREPYREQTERYAAQLEVLDKFVFFDGILRGSEFVKAIQQSDFLVMFSNYESFCVVILECLACGKPVLSSNAGGIPEFFIPESGKLINVGDETSLQLSINFMLDHFQEYDSHGMREYILKNFSYEVVGKQYYNLYNLVSHPHDSMYSSL